MRRKNFLDNWETRFPIAIQLYVLVARLSSEVFHSRNAPVIHLIYNFPVHSHHDLMALKLRQGQIWKSGDDYIRIVHLERLEVGYKCIKNLKTGEGKHIVTSKKDFCRLLKSCTLLPEKS